VACSQDDRRRGAKDASIHDKRTKKKKLQPSSTRLVDNELVRRHRQEELIKLQEQRNIEKQQKFEERKLKKARKREEKLKQREEEEREREREAQQRREREEKKLQQKQKRVPAGVTCLDSIDSLSRPPLAPPRERKNSSSSSGSSRSSRSLPRPRPPRMTPRGGFFRASSDSNIPTPSPPLPRSPDLPPHLPTPINDLPLPLDSLDQPKQCSGQQTGLKKQSLKAAEKEGVSLLPDSLPRNQPSQVFAVNPLAPSKAVTTAATSLVPAPGTATVTVAAKAGYNWNEHIYYWSLDQAGLTRPLQYGWDPVAPPHNYSSGPLGRNLQLQVAPTTLLWGSRGAFSAPGSTSTPPTPPSATRSSFGAIGKLSTTTTPPPTDLSSSRQPPKELCSSSKAESDGKKTGNNCGGYSLFSNGGQTIFGESLLNGQVSGRPTVSTETCVSADDCSSNEGASPRKRRFDEWPAL
jgi:hypothetical protein